ncbi:hypothetical protein FRC08_012108 [Ceratobasidium sp. 394]|nr:hypothetical protein FRC08_012108 [Ceratobasidium sp. 394]
MPRSSMSQESTNGPVADISMEVNDREVVIQEDNTNSSEQFLFDFLKSSPSEGDAGSFHPERPYPASMQELSERPTLAASHTSSHLERTELRQSEIQRWLLHLREWECGYVTRALQAGNRQGIYCFEISADQTNRRGVHPRPRDELAPTPWSDNRSTSIVYKTSIANILDRHDIDRAATVCLDVKRLWLKLTEYESRCPLQAFQPQLQDVDTWPFLPRDLHELTNSAHGSDLRKWVLEGVDHREAPRHSSKELIAFYHWLGQGQFVGDGANAQATQRYGITVCFYSVVRLCLEYAAACPWGDAQAVGVVRPISCENIHILRRCVESLMSRVDDALAMVAKCHEEQNKGLYSSESSTDSVISSSQSSL